MNSVGFPGNRPMGTQLAVGSQSSLIYEPTVTLVSGSAVNRKDEAWLKPNDDEFPSIFLNLRCDHLGLLTGSYMVQESANGKTYSNRKKNFTSEEYVIEQDEGQDDGNEIINDSKPRYEDLHLKQTGLPPFNSNTTKIFKDVVITTDSMFDRSVSPVAKGNVLPNYFNKLGVDSISSGLSSSSEIFQDMNRGENLEEFDPNVANLFAAGLVQTSSELRTGKGHNEILAYSAGNLGSSLVIEVVEREGHAIRTSGVNTTINLQSRIKSIKLPSLSSSLGRFPNYIGVLTIQAFYIIKISHIDKMAKTLALEVFDPVFSVAVSDFDLADFAFNPWDTHEFALLDVKGGWVIGNISRVRGDRRRLVINNNKAGSTYDPEVLSNWRRISWSFKYNRILVLDPTKMIEIDYKNEWQLEVVQAKTWSRLRDLYRINDHYSVLLTSKEIIVFGKRDINVKDKDDDLTRIISWKHDLDASDATIKLTVQTLTIKDKDLHVVCVYSKRHNGLLIHGFSYNKKKNLIQTLGDSKVIFFDSVVNGIGHLAFVESDLYGRQWMLSKTLESDLKISMTLLVRGFHDNDIRCYKMTNSDIAFTRNPDRQMPMKESAVTKSQNVATKSLSSWDEILKELYLKNKKYITQRLLHLDRIQPETDLQELGLHISDKLNSILNSYHEENESVIKSSLIADLVPVPEVIDDVDEFSSFLVQLFRYYQDYDIEFTKLKHISEHIFHEEIDDLEIFYGKLLQCFEISHPSSENTTKKILTDIVWSLLRWDFPSDYDVTLDRCRQKLSSEYGDIFRIWDDDVTQEHMEYNGVQNTVPVSSQPQFMLNSLSQIPTIKSSQLRPSIGNSQRLHKVGKQGRGFDSSQASTSSQLKSVLDTQISISSSPLPSITQLPSTLPDVMAPTFSLEQRNASNAGPADSQGRSSHSQRSKRKKKKISGFG